MKCFKPLAIGAAYATSVVGGGWDERRRAEAAGLNRSDVHVDFMIGSNQMDIDGIREDGTRVPLFRNGGLGNLRGNYAWKYVCAIFWPTISRS